MNVNICITDRLHESCGGNHEFKWRNVVGGDFGLSSVLLGCWTVYHMWSEGIYYFRLSSMMGDSRDLLPAGNFVDEVYLLERYKQLLTNVYDPLGCCVVLSHRLVSLWDFAVLRDWNLFWLIDLFPVSPKFVLLPVIDFSHPRS
ncbi:hypothetical protein OUZ56_013350 [Daphnia magna]|uniref:Uncharacterized protein n=1 Tax=Daphnia magna TaxID=35525 RepID=A0ABQ9Z5L9_9CRUS|nr:hypothetical protein OUZ56_013350 [Daphnia magna]